MTSLVQKTVFWEELDYLREGPGGICSDLPQTLLIPPRSQGQTVRIIRIQPVKTGLSVFFAPDQSVK